MRKGVVIGSVCFAAALCAFLVAAVSLHKPDPAILLMDAAEGEDLPAIKSLIQQGTPINQRSRMKWGWTPLIAACVHYHGESNVIQYLVESGANINQTDINGMTAIMWLTYHGDRAAPMVKYLIAHGARLDAKDNYGATVFSYAKAEPPAPQLLEALETAPLEQQTNSGK